MISENLQAFIEEWIEATNSHDLNRYLAFFNEDAVLDDPSVGRVFTGKNAVTDYYNSYFIVYNTRTRKVRAEVKSASRVYVEVVFTGSFAEGELGGTFDITLRDGKITKLTADLLNEIYYESKQF